MKRFKTPSKLAEDYVSMIILSIALEEYAADNKKSVADNEDISHVEKKLLTHLASIDFIDADDFDGNDSFIRSVYTDAFCAIECVEENGFQFLLDYELQCRITMLIIKQILTEGYWIFYPIDYFADEFNADVQFICNNIKLEYNESLLNHALVNNKKIISSIFFGDTVEDAYIEAKAWLFRNGYSPTEYQYAHKELIVVGNGEKCRDAIHFYTAEGTKG